MPIITDEQQARLRIEADAVTQAADKLKYVRQQDETADSDSDSSSECSFVAGATELEEIAEDIKTDAECLLDLGSRFQEQAVGPVVTEKAVDPTQIRTWDPSRNFIDRVRWRFPQCDIELARRLGKANWARVLNYQEIKNRNCRQPLESHTATKGGSSHVASTTFHDSGLGTSAPSVPSALSGPAPSQYTETVVSYHGGQGDSVRIPALPEAARKGLPFACVGCGKMVSITNRSQWKLVAYPYDLS